MLHSFVVECARVYSLRDRLEPTQNGAVERPEDYFSNFLVWRSLSERPLRNSTSNASPENSPLLRSLSRLHLLGCIGVLRRAKARTGPFASLVHFCNLNRLSSLCSEMNGLLFVLLIVSLLIVKQYEEKKNVCVNNSNICFIIFLIIFTQKN